MQNGIEKKNEKKIEKTFSVLTRKKGNFEERKKEKNNPKKKYDYLKTRRHVDMSVVYGKSH